ncbi:MAG: IclR family transcriptional regulator [Hyphomicrobiaceae bacterium]
MLSRSSRSGSPGPHEENAKYKVEAVARAAVLLEALRASRGPMTVVELAKATGFSAPVVEATLATLERPRLVASSRENGEASKDVGYRLGLAWLQLADIKRQQLDIREVAQPVLRRVRDVVNETVSVGVRIGPRRVNLDYAEGQHEVRRITQSGFHAPLHVGAAGRVLLSGLDDREIADYLSSADLRVPASTSRVSRQKLAAEIEQVRNNGYAIISGEVTTDTAAVSAPIRNHVGEVVGALTISCPQDRFGPQAKTLFIRHATAAAEEVSMALGYDPRRKPPGATGISRRGRAKHQRSAGGAKLRSPKRRR